MPGHETPLNKLCDNYTIAPTLIWQVLSFARLTPAESMVLNHIIINSINVFGVKHPNKRKWTVLSPSEFGNERGLSRQGIQDALKNLVHIGLILSRETIYQTASGHQKGREYQLVSNEKLLALYELLSTSAKPKGAKHELAPKISLIEVGARPEMALRQATLGTPAGHALHLDRPYLAPWGVKLPKSWEKTLSKESLNSFKYFLKTFSTFDFSYYELFSTTVSSKAATFKIETKIASLIRRYSYFSAFIATTTCTLNKPSQMGNFDVIEAFLKENSERIQIQEKNFVHLIDQLFFDLMSLHESMDLTRLEIFKENFKANASVLLAKKMLEASSSEIFIYSSIQDDILYAFETSVFNMERFNKVLRDKLDLYFKAKLLGIKGLNFVQAH